MTLPACSAVFGSKLQGNPGYKSALASLSPKVWHHSVPCGLLLTFGRTFYQKTFYKHQKRSPEKRKIGPKKKPKFRLNPFFFPGGGPTEAQKDQRITSTCFERFAAGDEQLTGELTGTLESA